jgi:tripartite-type tricarboxylate transporter receptor subunit TctC
MQLEVAMLRRFVLTSRAAAMSIAVVAATGAAAQNFPDRPIRVVVPFSAGSASDVVARLVLDKMSSALDQQFIVENQPGAGGNIGTAAIARAEPNGYNLLISNSGALAVNKTLTKNLPYDPERDFQPITMLATLPNVIVVGKTLPVASLEDLVAYAKARPDELTYSSVGIGSSQHLAGLFFEQLTGTKLRHLPYRVTAQLVTDVMTGIVPISFQLIPNVLGQLRSGDLRALAITAKARSAALPDVPTTIEAGLSSFESSAWIALLAPRKTPDTIVARLNEAAVAALNDPALRTRLTEIGADAAPTRPEELRTFISTEVVKWREIIQRGSVATD